MRAFTCRCGQPIFFENLLCLACGAVLGYDPRSRELKALDPLDDGLWRRSDAADDPDARTFRTCVNREAAAACNWLVPSEEEETACVSCRLTRTVPDLSQPKNAARLFTLETAKRRVVYELQGMGLPLDPQGEEHELGLAFDFLEPMPDQPVMTGHADGVVTLSVIEADADRREQNRVDLDEPYRTVIGHLRHELGHYYWQLLVLPGPMLPGFRALFGDEQPEYAEALKHHYANGAPDDWRERFISAYAAAHPWEDWAETWAHYMHLRSTLETAALLGVATNRTPLRVTPFEESVLEGVTEPDQDDRNFLDWVNAWVVLTAVVNEIARSMGQPDLYPFVLNIAAVRKLHFVHRLVQERRGVGTAPVPPTLAAPTV